MELEQIIGRNIKYWRGIRRKSMDELSIETGIPQSYLRSFEEGNSRPKPEYLLKLCDVLDVNASDLLNER